MITDIITVASSLSWWELSLLVACSLVVASGICGVLGMGDDF